MNMAEALYILEEEQLRFYNWFGEHKIRPCEVMIDYDGMRWIVCAADERACIVETSRRFFNQEDEALDCLIRLVRLGKAQIQQKHP